MKTLGELLTAARNEAGITQQTISRRTKIELKYIKALENNDYDKLPPSTYTKGFIRNYTKAVNKSPDELIAVYRRDSKPSSKDTPKTTEKFSLKHPFKHFSNTLLFIIIGVLTFATYFAFQFRAIITPPPLTITQPENQSVVTSPITFEGKTTPDSIVTINGDTTVNPDQSGVFLIELNYSPGDYQVTISATNRFGRTATKNLTISVISQ